uniref:Uncharacterized protein n=1 Tax=Bombyx mori TaxID=7091 RepID=A0A8R2LUL5_BOMMO|nr:uncharacterized protein LOC119628393 [Bombyx mori]
MENQTLNNEKRFINKARSHNTGPSQFVRNEPVKRKSVLLNETINSLDLAFGRLKKCRLSNGVGRASTPGSPTIRHRNDILMNSSRASTFSHGLDNISLMSMNFSHYELMRNLSQANSNSDGTFSGSNCNTATRPVDLNEKNEHLERYFRSAEIWSDRNCGSSGLFFFDAKK